jgi:hypothetical protein
MNPKPDLSKPVQPTQQTPSTRASDPREVRQERPDAKTQNVQTPDGGAHPPSGARRS